MDSTGVLIDIILAAVIIPASALITYFTAEHVIDFVKSILEYF